MEGLCKCLCVCFVNALSLVNFLSHVAGHTFQMPIVFAHICLFHVRPLLHTCDFREQSAAPNWMFNIFPTKVSLSSQFLREQISFWVFAVQHSFNEEQESDPFLITVQCSETQVILVCFLKEDSVGDTSYVKLISSLNIQRVHIRRLREQLFEAVVVVIPRKIVSVYDLSRFWYVSYSLSTAN